MRDVAFSHLPSPSRERKAMGFVFDGCNATVGKHGRVHKKAKGSAWDYRLHASISPTSGRTACARRGIRTALSEQVQR